MCHKELTSGSGRNWLLQRAPRNKPTTPTPVDLLTTVGAHDGANTYYRPSTSTNREGTT